MNLRPLAHLLVILVVVTIFYLSSTAKAAHPHPAQTYQYKTYDEGSQGFGGVKVWYDSICIGGYLFASIVTRQDVRLIQIVRGKKYFTCKQ